MTDPGDDAIAARRAVMWMVEHGALTAYGSWEGAVGAVARGEIGAPAWVRAAMNEVMSEAAREADREAGRESGRSAVAGSTAGRGIH